MKNLSKQKKRGELALLALLIVSIGAKASSNSSVDPDIKVTLIPTKDYFSFGGPIGISLTITNLSSEEIFCGVCDNYQPIYYPYSSCGTTDSYKTYFYPR